MNNTLCRACTGVYAGNISEKLLREQRNHGLKYESGSVSIGIGIEI
jgi:hypothetical protein